MREIIELDGFARQIEYNTMADRAWILNSIMDCPSCRANASVLSPANCPSTVDQGSTHPFSVVPEGGTPPYIYTWEITCPDGNVDVINTPTASYTFALVGTYTVKSTIKDNCPGSTPCINSCVIISQVAPLPPPTGNLLLNPGFETGVLGSPDNWWNFQQGRLAVLTYPEPGRVGGSSIGTEYPSLEENKQASWGQGVPVSPLKSYKLSGWVKTSNVMGSGWAGAFLQIDWIDPAGKYLNSSFPFSPQLGTVDWMYYEGVVTPDPGSSQGTVLATLINASGKAFFDDMSFTESEIVPPPTCPPMTSCELTVG